MGLGTGQSPKECSGIVTDPPIGLKDSEKTHPAADVTGGVNCVFAGGSASMGRLISP